IERAPTRRDALHQCRLKGSERSVGSAHSTGAAGARARSIVTLRARDEDLGPIVTEDPARRRVHAFHRTAATGSTVGAILAVGTIRAILSISAISTIGALGPLRALRATLDRDFRPVGTGDRNRA